MRDVKQEPIRRPLDRSLGLLKTSIAAAETGSADPPKTTVRHPIEIAQVNKHEGKYSQFHRTLLVIGHLVGANTAGSTDAQKERLLTSLDGGSPRRIGAVRFKATGVG
ncbi:MAG: hypothetical protein ACKPEY_21735 [Planctomycetota bacterium]